MTPVLVVDDELQIRRLLRLYLERNGFTVFEATSCAEGKNQFIGVKPSLVLLDLGLPDGDGREVLRTIRDRGDTPVIVLSVRDAEEEIIELLDSGADDYLIKPFGTGELVSRIRVALRHRTPKEALGKPIRVGLLDLRLDRREAYREGKEEHLTPTEWSILEILVRNAGKIMTRKQILQEVWGPAMAEEYNNLRVYINQIRKKIESEPSAPKLLMTEPGVGYRLRIEP
jgi:two-component system KDP operon response regulator KdpE